MHEKVMGYIEQNQEAMIKKVQELVQIESVNPGVFEKEVSKAFQSQMDECGFVYEVKGPADNRPSVLVKMLGEVSEGGLLFNGHLDTVPFGDIEKWSGDPLNAEIKDGRLYGRGSTDMKGAVVAFAMAMEAVKQSGIKLKKPVYLHAVADEESGGRQGTGYLIEQNLIPKVDMAFTGESSTYDGEMSIIRTCAGIGQLSLKSYGKPSHASKPYEGNNAIINMARVLIAIQDEFEIPTEELDSLLPMPTKAPGTMISGGIKTNVIPEYCEAMMDMRTNPQMDREHTYEALNEIVAKLKVKHPEINVELEMLFWDNATLIPEDSFLVKEAKKAVQQAVGYTPVCRKRPGATDARLLNDIVPCLVAFGPGDVQIGNIHGYDESVGIEDLINWSKTYACLILNICS